MNKPQDFDQYWKKVQDELASIQPAAERTELHLRSAPEAKVYGLKLTSLDHYRIFAYFCVPSGKGPFPVIYRLPNYGSVVHIPPFEERCKYISVALCHRGQRLSDQPFAAKYPGLLTSGIDSQFNYIYRSIVADCLRVMDYLVSCDDVDSQKISLVGGDLALFTAALRDSASVLFYTPSLFYKALHKATATQNYPLEEFNDYLRSFPQSINSLRSNLQGFQYYDISVEVVDKKNVRSRYIHLDYVYSSTCPCSLELSEHARKERNQLATPHSQRSVARISVEILDTDILWFEDLIDICRSAVPTETQVMVKREDEQAFAEMNAANPIFVEDAVRLFCEALKADDRIGDFRVIASHQESLHSHDAISIMCEGPTFDQNTFDPKMFSSLIHVG